MPPPPQTLISLSLMTSSTRRRVAVGADITYPGRMNTTSWEAIHSNSMNNHGNLLAFAIANQQKRLLEVIELKSKNINVYESYSERRGEKWSYSWNKIMHATTKRYPEWNAKKTFILLDGGHLAMGGGPMATFADGKWCLNWLSAGFLKKLFSALLLSGFWRGEERKKGRKNKGRVKEKIASRTRDYLSKKNVVPWKIKPLLTLITYVNSYTYFKFTMGKKMDGKMTVSRKKQKAYQFLVRSAEIVAWLEEVLDTSVCCRFTFFFYYCIVRNWWHLRAPFWWC